MSIALNSLSVRKKIYNRSSSFFDKIPAFKAFSRNPTRDPNFVASEKGNAGISQINTEVQNRLTAKGDPISQGKGSTALYSNDRVMQTAND